MISPIGQHCELGRHVMKDSLMAAYELPFRFPTRPSRGRETVMMMSWMFTCRLSPSVDLFSYYRSHLHAVNLDIDNPRTTCSPNFPQIQSNPRTNTQHGPLQASPSRPASRRVPLTLPQDPRCLQGPSRPVMRPPLPSPLDLRGLQLELPEAWARHAVRVRRLHYCGYASRDALRRHRAHFGQR
jgi:hypothetical protein